MNRLRKDSSNSPSLYLILARSPLVLEIVSAVLNLSRNNFSRVCEDSIDPGVSKVNQVRVLSNKVLGKALQSMASPLVNRPMADL